MNHSFFLRLSLGLAACLAAVGICRGQADSGDGKILVAARKGQVRFLDQAGQALPDSVGQVNGAIPVGTLVETGPDSLVILLFSNGTVGTLSANAHLVVTEFEQDAFDPAEKKMADLQQEPSSSTLELDLEFGTLIMGTKKLSKNSSLTIDTPAGTAGVRGTQFQISQVQGGSFALDVAESTVAFSPKSGQAQVIGAGRGLQVASTGFSRVRLIDPAAQVRITKVNESAFQLTKAIPLAQVVPEVQPAETKEATPSENTPEQEDPSSPDEEATPEGGEATPDAEESSNDPSASPEEPTPETEPEPTPETEPEPTPETEPGLPPETEPGLPPETEPGLPPETEPSAEPLPRGPPPDADPGLPPSLPDDLEPPDATPTGPPSIEQPPAGSTPTPPTTNPSSPQPNANLIQGVLDGAASPMADSADTALDHLPEAQLLRKVGALDDFSHQAIQLGLNEIEMQRLYDLSPSTRAQIMRNEPDKVSRLLTAGATGEQLLRLLAYSPSLRQRIFSIRKDDAILNLLNVSYPEQVVQNVLTDERIAALNATVPSTQSSTPRPQRSEDIARTEAELAGDATVNGNPYLLPMLQETSGGGDTLQEQIDAGVLGNLLLTDLIFEGAFLADRLFPGEQVMANPYYEDASSTLSAGSAFLGSPDTRFQAYAGRNLSLLAGEYDFSPAFRQDAQFAVLSASESLDFHGNVSFSAWTPQPTLVLMSGNEFAVQPGATLAYPGGNLSLLAGGNLSVENATLQSGDELGIKGLREVHLENSTIEAKRAKLEAAGKLSLRSVVLGRDLSALYLQATTVNLKNVDFPGGSMININSLKGGIDGKYPNFGTENFGRVNFLENVKYGGNLMDDRPSFDQHGQNVTIGKIPQP